MLEKGTGAPSNLIMSIEKIPSFRVMVKFYYSAGNATGGLIIPLLLPGAKLSDFVEQEAKPPVRKKKSRNALGERRSP